MPRRVLPMDRSTPATDALSELARLLAQAILRQSRRVPILASGEASNSSPPCLEVPPETRLSDDVVG